MEMKRKRSSFLQRTFVKLLFVTVIALYLTQYFGVWSYKSLKKNIMNKALNLQYRNPKAPTETSGQRRSSYRFPKRQWNSAVDCKAVFDGNSKEINRAFNMSHTDPKSIYQDWQLVDAIRNCSHFTQNRAYILHHLSSVEKGFSLAYSITMHKDPGQVERLLRAIYRPQNAYCIHVDKKASENIKTAMNNLADCFENVFLSSESVEVTWGTYSVLYSQIVCYRDLFYKFPDWKYVINLAGQAFPLKTNLEIVRTLNSLNGHNDVLLAKTGNKERKRWETAGQPPHNIFPSKGSVSVSVTRNFVNFILTDKRVQDFLVWLNNTIVPDETFFSSLNYNNTHLQTPGSFNGTEEQNRSKPYFSRFTIWDEDDTFRCHGKYVRQICICGVGDLPLLATREELFVNKLHWDYQHFALTCLEEWHFNKTRNQYLELLH